MDKFLDVHNLKYFEPCTKTALKFWTVHYKVYFDTYKSSIYSVYCLQGGHLQVVWLPSQLALGS